MDKHFLIGALAGVALVGVGFLVGSQARPETQMSTLAASQLVAQDKDVRWIGYHCGDDGAVLLTHEMPNISECKEVRRLPDEDDVLDNPLS